MSESHSQRAIWERDADAAAQYDRFVVPLFLAPWAKDLVDAAQLEPGERVLDLACGTGLVTREAARRVGTRGRVTGLDIVPVMLAVAKRARIGGGSRIRWVEGDAAAIPFASGAFDAVLCHQGFQFFPDRSAALREIRRVLAPGGRLALAVWSRIERNPYFLAVAEALARHVEAEAGERMRSSFALGDPEDVRSLLAGASFDGADIRPLAKRLRLPSPEELVQNHLAGTSLARTVAALRTEIRDRLVADVAGRLGGTSERGEMSQPFEIHLAHWPAKRGESERR